MPALAFITQHLSPQSKLGLAIFGGHPLGSTRIPTRIPEHFVVTLSQCIGNVTLDLGAMAG